MNDVTVCILSCDRERYLIEAIRSAIEQNMPAKRIVVLDNCSGSDLTSTICGKFGANIDFRGAEKRHSVQWNWSRAMEYSDTEFLYVMHDDDVLLPEFLSQQTHFLREYPSVIATACNGFEIDPDGKRLGTTLHNPERRKAIEVFPSRKDVVRLYLKTFLAFPSIVYRVPYPAMIPFPEENGQGVDVMFLCNLAARGTVAFQNKLLFEYRVHPKQDSAAFRKDSLNILDDFFLEMASCYPDIARDVGRYLMRRKISRFWKQLWSFRFN